MEDVGGKMPEPHQLSNVPAEPISIPTLDGWIDNLMDCKQLAEQDVQRLCDKVRSRGLSGLLLHSYAKSRIRNANAQSGA